MILEPRYYRIDSILRRPYTSSTPFGSSGNGLWAASPQGWGLASGVHWIHKTGDTGLGPIQFCLTADGVAVIPGDAIYRPSHVTLHGLDAATGLQVTEDKFLTPDDVVVSVLTIRNPGEYHVDVRLDLAWGVPAGENRFRDGVPVFVHREGPPLDDLWQRLPGGSHRTIVFAVSFAPTMEEARARARRWTEERNPTITQAEAYQQWFDDNILLFDCSDPWITKLWYHWWDLLKKNRSNAGTGFFRQDSFSEGQRNRDMYSATIPHGPGHILRELRWLKNPEYTRDYFRRFVRSEREEGLFRSFSADGVAQPDSLAITGLAQSLRETGEGASEPAAQRTLLDRVTAFARAQYEDGDFDRPHTGEFYRGDTGNHLIEKREYLHSTWADLILSGLIGIVPREDEVLEIHPLLPTTAEGGWSHFCAQDVPYHGRRLTIVWDDPADPEDHYSDGLKGMVIFINGRKARVQNDLSPLTVSLDADS